MFVGYECWNQPTVLLSIMCMFWSADRISRRKLTWVKIVLFCNVSFWLAVFPVLVVNLRWADCVFCIRVFVLGCVRIPCLHFGMTVFFIFVIVFQLYSLWMLRVLLLGYFIECCVLFAFLIYHKIPIIRVRRLKRRRTGYVPVLWLTPSVDPRVGQVPEDSVSS